MYFGEYLEEKRKSRNYTIRLFARRVNISYTYLADVEKGRSKAFKLEILNKIIEILKLDEEETDMLYDLAGKSRDTIAPDVEEYLKENKEIIKEIRKIKKGTKMYDREMFDNLSDEELEKIVKEHADKLIKEGLFNKKQEVYVVDKKRRKKINERDSL